MAGSLGTLRVDLIADIARFSKGLSRAEQIAQKRSRAIRNTIRSIGGAFGAISVGSLVGGTVKAFSEFEKNLVAVGKTADLEGKALEEFGDKILDIGKKVPVSNNALLQIAATAAQVGVKGSENIAKFTETMARLELATDVVGQEGAASIARLLNVTKTAVTDVDKFANVLVELGNNSAATEAEIVEMATKIGSATAQFGVSANAAAAYGAAFKSLGQEADATSSVLGKVFIALDQATRQGGEDLQRIADIAGMTKEAFRDLFAQDSAQAANAFITGLGKINEAGGDVVGTLEDIGLKGDRVTKILGSAANASGTITTSFALMNKGIEENNALFIESIKSAKTFSGQMTLLGNSANSAAVELGKLIAPAALKAVQGLSSASRALSENIVYVKDAAVLAAAAITGRLLVAVSSSQAAVALWAIAAGNVNLALVAMQVKLAIATRATWLFNAALAANPLVLIASAVAALGAAVLIYKNHTDAAVTSTDDYKNALLEANRAGESAEEQTKRLSRARIEERIETLKAAEAELELALAQQKFIQSRAPEVAPAYKNAAKAAAGLEEQLRETQLAIASSNEELLDVDAAAKKAADATTAAAAGAGKAEVAFKDMGDAAAASVQDLSAMGQALDMIDQQFAELDAAEARKIAGVDDQSYEAAVNVRAAADSVDPNRQLSRDIQRLQDDIELAPTAEGVEGAKERLAQMQDEYNKNAQGLSDGYKKSTDEMSEFAIAAARSMQGAMSDGFFSIMQGETDDLAANFKRTIDRMVADLLSSQLLDMVSGLGGAGGGGFFGFLGGLIPGLAGGGKTYANHPYVVGEEGPELFVPSNSGNIIPNGGTVGGVTNITVNTPDANSFRRSQRQIAMDSARMQAQARAFA